MTDIETRLDELERHNQSLQKSMRRSARVAQCCTVALIATIATGAANLVARKNADFDIVTARQVRVVDEDGKAKVLIAGNKQSNPQIVQGYIAVLDDKQNGAAIFGHWGNGDLLWFANGDSSGNNLVLGALKDEVVIHSANNGKYNYRIFADARNSGIQFTERVATTAATSQMQETVTTDLAKKGTP
ncbi:hypothetical protein [Maioricimonas sp. JC845]|uniref:hypothetical protein n=1 Tax=Maioricimonas sp. JC845 TaxID=3232138 RepID=UPI00345B3D11